MHPEAQRYSHWQILLIDRYRIGDGATSHSAGVLLATGRSERERRLGGESAGLYRALPIDGVPPTNAAALCLPQSDAYLMPLAARNQWLFSLRCEEWGAASNQHALEVNPHAVHVAPRTLAQGGTVSWRPGFLRQLHPLRRDHGEFQP